jgi:hypothetical protein
VQKRLPKFRRAPEAIADKKVTERGLLIVEKLAQFRFLATSDIIRLSGGNEDVTYRHLQQLYHQDLISRMALPKNGGYGEFIYFLDNSPALKELVQSSKLDSSAFDWKEIKANKDKYRDKEKDGVGHFLFIQHELMISRFRADLEIECGRSGGRVVLNNWLQGSRIWNSVQDGKKVLPHRPDAFFSLHFPNSPEGQQKSSFFYEADRGTSSMGKLKEKLEAHVLFLLAHKHIEYGVQKIRAVLVHTITKSRTEQLQDIVAQLAAKQPLAAHLFWLASSEELAGGNIFDPSFTLLSDSRKRSLLD